MPILTLLKSIILALIFALVLLFGRGGARKILGRSVGLVIVGFVTIMLWGWVSERQQAQARYNAAPAPSGNWTNEQANDWYRRNGGR
jgi:hypothetical protein